MRKEKEENLELVYSAMKSLYDKTRDWRTPLSFKEIKDRVNKTLEEEGWKSNRTKKELHRITIDRQLKTLMKEKPPRVIKRGRSQYTIDYAIEQRDKEREEITKSILSIKDYHKLKGRDSMVWNGQKVEVPVNPIYKAPETHSISQHIKKWRLQVHGQKDVAQAEADVWVNSFITSLSYDIGTGEAPLKIRPEKLVTTGKKVGVNAFIFRKAMEIMLELLESLDPKFLKQDKTNSCLQDAQISIVIKFDPVLFLRMMKAYRDTFEIMLNSKRVPKSKRKFPFGVEYKLDKNYLEKRIFNEIFKNQPNDALDPANALRGLPDEIKELMNHKTIG